MPAATLRSETWEMPDRTKRRSAASVSGSAKKGDDLEPVPAT
ncbi:hypothetical protein ACFPZI_08825 [Streptomyces chlorus]|uniref:Uncharacterized protein n=1 Tax=Streptomyces chlorus TaxID=887452 RepID=A0ABW1DUG6_9ACTN